jgi:hypothetical protein
MPSRWQLRVGHFSVQARQLTSQACREGHKKRLAHEEGAERVLRALFVRGQRKQVSKMNGGSFTRGADDETRLRELYAASRRDGWTWQAAGAAFGLVSGGAVAITGALLLAVAWSIGSKTGELSLHGVGSVLLLSTIPLLLAGGHCLDLLEKRIEKRRQTDCGAAGNIKTRAKSRVGLRVAVVALALLCVAHSQARAQQTLFNVPSTDVLDKGGDGQAHGRRGLLRRQCECDEGKSLLLLRAWLQL